MKEIEQFSIGGYAFTLEKDAAALLSNYLKELEEHYMPQESGKEIMEGIEERVAELLLESSGRGGVVNQGHVLKVIDVIGRPENIEADDPAPEGPAPDARKKLFRDMENKRLGGVCSGLAAYLGTEVTWIRVLFTVSAVVMLFAGEYTEAWSLSVPVLYCVLWLAMPAARTARDRWAMKGDGGTLDDIRRNVRSGIQEMGDAAREVGRGDFFRNFGRFLIIVIGLVLLIVGTTGLASTAALSMKGTSLFGADISWWMDMISGISPWLYDLISTPWVVALMVLAVILPFVGMLYGGIQLIFGFKDLSWRPSLVIFVCWIIILVVLAVLFCEGLIVNGAATDW